MGMESRPLPPRPVRAYAEGMRTLLLLLLGALLAAGEAPRLILDTDMDSDCDDAAALALLHALADRGEVEPLAVMISGLDPWAAPCVQAIDAWYGRPDLPIGTARPPASRDASLYTRGVAERHPGRLASSADAPEAVSLYRRILAAQPDGSVTIASIGDLTNLARLLAAPADADGPAGAELVRRKVKRWVCMGGNFIGDPPRDDLRLGNRNFTVDPPASLAAVRGWPGAVVFAGREMCSVPSGLKAGAVLGSTPVGNPVRQAYELYFGGTAKDRHVADPVTVLFAVRGPGAWWEVSAPGRMDLQPDMTFTWVDGPGGTQRYLRRLPGSDRAVEAAIDQLLLQPPRRR